MASSSSPAGAPPLNGPSIRFFDRQERGGRGVILSQPAGGHSVEILFHGAQVVSWKTSGMENLFFSSRAVYAPLNPFRGGIPICFPKFSNIPDVELQHGFARRSFWNYDFHANENTDMPPPPADYASADFILEVMNIEPVEFEHWPNRFEFRLRIILEPTGQLSMISRIKNVNINGMPFTFPFSYQNYLFVFDISEIQIEGLERRGYRDYKRNGERFSQGDDAFTLNSAVDRLYLNSPNKIILRDFFLARNFTIEKNSNLPNIVVWNPWDVEAAALTDPEDERTNMVVVEAAAQQDEIMLFPDQEWMAIQRLSVTFPEDGK